MIVEQHAYLSEPAKALRRRDEVRPWQVHPCEVDDFTGWKPGTWPELDAARALRDELEAAGP